MKSLSSASGYSQSRQGSSVYPTLCPGPYERGLERREEQREGQENVRNEGGQSGDVRCEHCVLFAMSPKKKKRRRKPNPSENN